MMFRNSAFIVANVSIRLAHYIAFKWGKKWGHILELYYKSEF